MPHTNKMCQGHEINVIIDGTLWQKQELEYQTLIASIVNLVLSKELISEYTELNVRLTDDAVIQGLNKEFRNQDKPTNVLSFPAEPDEKFDELFAEELLPLGDIALAYETIEREAANQGKTFKNHFIHLLIHGTLHLLGFDHITEEEAEEMESAEITLLKILKIDNPYQKLNLGNSDHELS